MKTLVIDDDGRLKQALEAEAAVFLASDDMQKVASSIAEPEVESVVIGSKAGNPLHLAQEAAKLDKGLAVLILPNLVDEGNIRRQRILTPFLGDDVRILSESSPEELDLAVKAACSRTHARRRHKRKLATTTTPALEMWSPASDALLDMVLEQAPLGLVVIEPAGRIRAWNRYLANLTGIQAREALGRRPTEIRSPKSLNQLMSALEKSTLESTICVKPAPGKGARRYHLQISQQPLQGQSGEPGRLITLHDVSGRVAAEQERTARERHQADTQRLESLGLLAGGIAHDFNNILGAILGNAELALRLEGCGAPIREHLEEIVTATLQASELTRQMLTYAGRSPAAILVQDLNEIIRDTGGLLRACVSKSATLEIELSPSRLPVNADIAQIRQVLLNLVTNASDAIGESHGRISIRTRRVGDRAEVSVQDTGAGMDAATKRRILEPFFSTKGLGRGLGLSAVSGIIHAHQGEFFIESTPGVGTRFSVQLPLADEDVASKREAEQVEELPRPPPGTRALVVDDEDPIRDLASKALSSAGYEVEKASDGSEALATLLMGKKFDVVLLDYSMPGLSGEEFMRELSGRGIRVPIVLCSGYADVDQRTLGNFDNLRAFLAKPYTLEQLTHTVLDALEIPPSTRPKTDA